MGRRGKHAAEVYNLTEKELDVLNRRIRNLQKARFIETKAITKYSHNFCYYVVEGTKPYVQKVIEEG